MATTSLAGWTGRFTTQRRLVQLLFLAVFLLLPVFDLFRFDLPAGKLFFFGQEIWLDEWALLWLGLMLAMWLVGAVSLVFGRVYCAYACPQTVFSELAHDVDAIARRLTRGLPPERRPGAARALSLLAVAALSLATTALFMAYFAPLPEVLRRIASLDFGPWLGAVGATTTLLAFLNLVFVRESFCRSACPYGLLQGVIEDGRSLHVRLDEATGACIDCKACARTCPMGIDIRGGSFHRAPSSRTADRRRTVRRPPPQRGRTRSTPVPAPRVPRRRRTCSPACRRRGPAGPPGGAGGRSP